MPRLAPPQGRPGNALSSEKCEPWRFHAASIMDTVDRKRRGTGGMPLVVSEHWLHLFAYATHDGGVGSTSSLKASVQLFGRRNAAVDRQEEKYVRLDGLRFGGCFGEVHGRAADALVRLGGNGSRQWLNMDWNPLFMENRGEQFGSAMRKRAMRKWANHPPRPHTANQGGNSDLRASETPYRSIPARQGLFIKFPMGDSATSNSNNGSHPQYSRCSHSILSPLTPTDDTTG